MGEGGRYSHARRPIPAPGAPKRAFSRSALPVSSPRQGFGGGGKARGLVGGPREGPGAAPAPRTDFEVGF